MAIPEKIFYNGKVRTMDQTHPTAEAFAVSQGKVIRVGTNAEIRKLAAPGVIEVDLGGKAVIPSFSDCHLHLVAYQTVLEKNINLKDTPSAEAMVEKVKAFIVDKKFAKGEWVLGYGFDHEIFPTRALPDRHVLDQISQDHPIKLVRNCYHTCVVNSLALAVAGLDQNTPDPSDGKLERDAAGNPTGVIRENAMNLIEKAIPPITSIAEMKQLLYNGCMSLAAVGVTTVLTDDFPFVADKKKLLAAYRELEAEGRLPIRVILQLRVASPEEVDEYTAMGLKSGQGSDNLRIGPIKILADGSLGPGTACLSQPYSDNPHNQGFMLMDEQLLAKTIAKSFAADFDVTIHAIGDKTIDTVLNIYGSLQNVYEPKGLKPSIIHCQIASKEIMAKFKKYAVTAIIQPIFLHSDWHFAESRVGQERLKYSYCWKSFLEAGIKCVGSSDAPIEGPAPLWSIYAAVTRQDLTGKPAGGWLKDEALDLDDAVRLYTANIASFYGHEQNKGRLAAGMLADFLVLAEDLWEIPAAAIKDVAIEQVFVAGTAVK